MLSAIAARKAAQAANSHATSVPDEEPPSFTPTSKRKSSSQTLNSSRKRKKKREAELKKTRYFAAEVDTFHNSDDVIIIDSDEEDISDAPAAPITRTTVCAINDSSDEEGEKILDVPVPLALPPAPTHGPPQTLTSFSVLPDKTAFYLESEEIAALGLAADTCVLISLSTGQTVSLLGAYMFTVLRGAVSPFCGIRMPANRLHIAFMPAVFAYTDTQGFRGKPFTSSVRKWHYSRAGYYMPPFDGLDTDAGNHFRLQLTQPSKDIQPFILPATWELALKSLSDCTCGIYLVKGHKKSGKSTFARTLLNHLLCRYRRVAFLECDLGQSEFTPGGCPVFGPPFTHPTLPNFAHFVGLTTPRSSPSHYLASIQSLIETYQLDMQTPADDFDGDSRISDVIPLVVNTMGWTKGLGADLTRKIEDLVQPTDIFEVEAPFFERSLSLEQPASFPHASQSAKLHLLQPIALSVLSANYSAADHRSVAVLSYFHALFPRTASKVLGQRTAVMWNTTLPLCSQLPYEVDWSLAFDKVTLCGAGAEDVVPLEINRVLNGALVGLVAYEPGSLDDDIDMSKSSSDSDAAIVPLIPYTQGSAVPSPSTSVCHGIALIRAISPSSSHMHILTPLPQHLLSKCRVLVKGEMELPLWGMLDFLNDIEGEIAGVEKANGLGGEKRRVRRNLMRKGQM
ncbi:hypothetical protein B0H13DRAFT_2111015 [Mycena leptocephala]|nr:hypothetical protein B0H13DRAFT_2111015 [Mycena leptocephala]